MPTEREKYTIESTPLGYPTEYSRKDLKYIIKDLSDELINKSVEQGKDFINRGWKERIIAFIQLGHTELQQRNNTIMLIISGITLLIALGAIAVSLLTSWESSQIQQQILEAIKINSPQK